MKIKLTTSLAGAGFAYNAGEVIARDAAEAQRLIDKGFAVPVTEKKVERATTKLPAKEKRG